MAFSTGPSSLDNGLPWLKTRWNVGLRSALALWRVMQGQGCPGQCGVISQWAPRHRRLAEKANQNGSDRTPRSRGGEPGRSSLRDFHAAPASISDWSCGTEAVKRPPFTNRANCGSGCGRCARVVRPARLPDQPEGYRRLRRAGRGAFGALPRREPRARGRLHQSAPGAIPG